MSGFRLSSVLRRYVQSASDWLNCARLMGNPAKAYGYLRSGRAPQTGIFRVGPLCFQGRKEDWPAVRECLIEDEYSCVETLFAPKDNTPCILDLGANIGCFALCVFLRRPDAQVVSVEAAQDTFEVLQANQRRNPQQGWEVMNFGVWREDGPLTLMRRGASVSHRVMEGVGADADAVQGISLQTLVSRLGWSRIDLIKMDIEGGEEAVIPAALDVLQRTRFLIIEIHDDRIDPAPVLAALRSVYAYRWKLGARRSNKPVYIMANVMLPLGALDSDSAA
jgi:FkbM family methyltransferase